MEMTNETQALLLDCLLDLGQLLLECGAEISRVEDTISRISHAYGAKDTNVFVITSIISLTMEFPEHEAVTETRRIIRDGGTDFIRMEKLNALSRSVCAEPIPVEDLKSRIHAISQGKKPIHMQFWGSILAAGSYAVFFGGTFHDGLAAASFGAFICLLQILLDKTEINTVARNLLISLLVGLGVGITAHFDPTLQMDKILIGDIMLLIPGLAMINAVRNILLGNTISGLVRLADSLLWAGSLAGGFMIALKMINLLF
jgi:uncharacterized membrane protein YjjP (DUF1212 family)